MDDHCAIYREQLGPSLVGDLEPAGLRQLEFHLQTCRTCRQERDRLKQTIQELQSWEAVEAPHHFLVQPLAPAAGPRDLLRQLAWPWKAALVTIPALILLLGFLSFSRFQWHSENGVWLMSWGDASRLQPPDPFQSNSFRQQLDQLLTQREQQQQQRWLAQVRDENEVRFNELSKQRQENLDRTVGQAIRGLQLEVAADQATLQADFKKSDLALYQVLMAQRARDLSAMREELDLLAVSDEIQDTQTDALLATVIEIADSRGPAGSNP